MTIEKIKAVAKERYGKELSDEQAKMHLDALTGKGPDEEKKEIENADVRLEKSCGTPSDDKDPPSPSAGTVNKIKLRMGDSGFVAQMQIKWEYYEDVIESGKMVHKKIGFGTYEESGYHDICAYGDRTVDLKDTGIPENSDVWLKAIVSGGYDRIAKERFTFSSKVDNTAKYEIHGTICYNYLNRE